MIGALFAHLSRAVPAVFVADCRVQPITGGPRKFLRLTPVPPSIMFIFGKESGNRDRCGGSADNGARRLYRHRFAVGKKQRDQYGNADD